MPKRKNPETSIEAYHSLQHSEIREVYKKIIKALSEIKEGHTEDIAVAAGLEHEKIWKRMHELSDMGLIERPGNKKKMKSGRQGYTWKLTLNGEVVSSAERVMDGETVADFSRAIRKLSLPIQGALFPDPRN